MSKLLHPLSHSLLLLPFFFVVSMAADPNKNYTNCPSYDCNGVRISYPFWRIDNQATDQFCGYAGLGVNCSTIGNRELPIITLGNEFYSVDNILHKFSSMILVDMDAVADGCPRVRHRIDFGPLPLRFTPSNVDLSFHFNCTRLPSFATPIACLGNRSSVNVVGMEPEHFTWDGYGCDWKVETTVLNTSRPDWLQGWGVGQSLSRGFEVSWRRSDDCYACEESGGRCGLAQSQYMCFCSNGEIKNDRCNKGSKMNVGIKIAIGVCSAAAAIIMCLVFYFFHQCNKKRNYGSSYMSRNISSYASSMTDPEKNGTYHGVQIFKHRELEKATNFFDSKNELGDGGFGTVYKGKLRDGRVVAVKRLYENNYKRVEQFMNEVGILAHLRHQNLVSLYGCTTHHSRELLLVYEYIPNGTVADHLHGERSSPGSPTWATRMSIAIETASALVYLHASDVIHRDVKTNNILLDNNFCVKVADFGLSRLFPSNVTHISTAPQGTPGYVDPEYHECYHLTNKSDVYSLGVVLMELISSKPAVDITRHRHEINLSHMAVNKIRNDQLHEFVDPSLGFESDYEVRKMISAVAELAFQCLQNERDCRPSMEEVLEGLKGIQNGKQNEQQLQQQEDVLDNAVLLKNGSQTMSPDSVAIAWSTSTLSASSG